LPETAATCAIETYTTSDGYVCHYRRFQSPEPPKACVVCIHGIQSHGGWYEHSCQRISDAGYDVFFLDRRGSGLNTLDRGDAPGFRRLIDDLAEFIESRLREPRLNNGPVFLVAISWGGKLGIALQRRHSGLIRGLALLCPGLYAKVRPTLRQRLGIAKARFFSPRKQFLIPLNDPALFTTSPKWQQFIREDPLALRTATARLLVESLRLDGYLRVCRKHATIPVLLMLAEDDRIIDNARTRRFFDTLSSTDKTVIEYRGAHHTLEFEPEPTVFISDLIRWLDQHNSAALAKQSVHG
jgi:alpha-beta hydrolase superfamily lysophospholipase